MKLYRIVEFIPERGEVVPLNSKFYRKVSTAKGVLSREIGNRMYAARIEDKNLRAAYHKDLSGRVFIQVAEIQWAKL